MKQIKFILVNETGSESAVRAIRNSRVSDFRYCIIVDGRKGLSSKAQSSKERAALVDELCRLRRQWPEAPILGVSELDASARYAPIRVSEAMNQLRLELSNLP